MPLIQLCLVVNLMLLSSEGLAATASPLTTSPDWCQPACQITYRATEPCDRRQAFLIVDYLEQFDRCIRDADDQVLHMRCPATFTLEIKPGKDRCWRVDNEPVSH